MEINAEEVVEELSKIIGNQQATITKMEIYIKNLHNEISNLQSQLNSEE